jgi:hypothetical protein
LPCSLTWTLQPGDSIHRVQHLHRHQHVRDGQRGQAHPLGGPRLQQPAQRQRRCRGRATQPSRATSPGTPTT